MKQKNRIRIMFIVLLLLLILVFSSSYAWLTLSLAPQITDIDTNVGANGSLEIALLSEITYADPLMIQTKVGDSTVAQDALDSNLTWGNVIELQDERYGTEQITLRPARLNLSVTEADSYQVEKNMLNIAEFGIDGRISILSPGTVSATFQEKDFTYYVAGQKYGVRAIGTISNLTSQQKALAMARTETQSHTAATARTVKNIWRDNGPAIMDLILRRYGQENERFSNDDITLIRSTALKMQTALEYADLTLRQGVIGIAASQIADETDFETLQEMVSNTDVPLSRVLSSAEQTIPEVYLNWAKQLDEMQMRVLSVVAGCGKLSDSNSWEEIEPLLDILVDADKIYLGESILSGKKVILGASDGDVLTLVPDSGILSEIAEYAGNYSTFFRWTETCNIEVRTADTTETANLIVIVDALKKSSAASGGWTRANLDDTYGYAMDLAFRCNVDTNLLLQTMATSRVMGTEELPQTQGGGSYMRFTSEHMDTQQLVRLMDTIRVGFLDDRCRLIGLAKLNTSNYEEQEEGVFAPLYLYKFTLDEDGRLSPGERRSEDATILPLNGSTPTVVTVIVWLDGDHVDNSMVGYLSEQSMSGVLNLQFTSSADLRPTDIPIENNN